jgi:hypothetical protein
MSPEPTVAEATAAHAAASRAWNEAVHDHTIRLLRADATLGVDRARLLGEDDARQEHPDLFDAIWWTNEAQSHAEHRERVAQYETAIMAQGALGERMAGVISDLHGEDDA